MQRALLVLAIAGWVIVSSYGAEFIGAVEPAVAPASPVPPAEQLLRFSLPPGFEAELVASEEQGVGKPITVAWDDAARLWTITALEYPLDGNEQPDAAKALYQNGGRDQVLVIDNPYAATPGQPRVFADGLAMPMGILPYKDGALVGHGPDVLLMRDTDGDGESDRRDVILTGFGIQDSHLMPHQFTRAPGGWFYLAQGAFNYSRVKTRDGREHKFDQTRLARFTVDGEQFEDLTSGPCNIWGLVIGRQGETFIQEANDYGYPVMAFHAGASYPGCSGAFKPYSPYFPSEVQFRMGGTGLSGLAMSDPTTSFPGAYADVMYVANPITRKIQAIRIHPDGPWYRYEKLPDFVLSSDEWFRPVAIHFGPDGCLYIVDWYNKIISHNEVPRAHPERDKTRGRIWRIRHKDQSRNRPPNIAEASETDLLNHLKSESTWQMRAAWHQMVDRDLKQLAPELRNIVQDASARPEHRIHALWTLEGLGRLGPQTISALLGESNRNLRREAIRSMNKALPRGLLDFSLVINHMEDSDPEVRAEIIRYAGRFVNLPQARAILASMVKPSLSEPRGNNPHGGGVMKVREAYDRDFERYLIRAALEPHPDFVRESLAATQAIPMSVESQLLFALALPPAESSAKVAELLPKIDRIPNEEELLRLTETLNFPGSLKTLETLLSKPSARRITLDSLLKVRSRLDLAKLSPLLISPVEALWDEGDQELAARLAGSFKLEVLAPKMEKAIDNSPEGLQVVLLRALREVDGASAGTLARLVGDSKSRAVRDEALNSLVATRQDTGNSLLEFWPQMNAVQRRSALRSLGASSERAKSLVSALNTGTVRERELDAESLEKLRAWFPDNSEVQSLVERLSIEFRPVLRLDGKSDSYVDANIDLEGPFTVECWVRLEPGISNDDGILGAAGTADFNFAGGTFRVYCGPELGDRVIARKPITPNSWTHLAVTRDSSGAFRLFVNGEIDATDDRKVTNSFKGLDIGRTIPNRGTFGDLTEFRVWDRARSDQEIRNDFDRTFVGEEWPSGLAYYFLGDARAGVPDGSDPSLRRYSIAQGRWVLPQGGARVEKVADAPQLLTAAQAREQASRFAKYRSLAEGAGSLEKGRNLFVSACSVCHTVNGQGGQIGPVLNGASASGIETLLRALLTPNAAMEAGYRNYRVELQDDDVLDGFFVSEDENTIVLRQPNIEDRRIPKNDVRRSEFTRNSLMPEGLLDAMSTEDVRDLFAYLKTLK